MENKEDSAAKKEEGLFWKKCPLCGQEFKQFLPLIRHIDEHYRIEPHMKKVEFGAADYLRKAIAREFYPWSGAEPSGEGMSQLPRRKLADKSVELLLAVEAWLETALETHPELNEILTSDVKVAGQLVTLAGDLPDGFREQREYLLNHRQLLEDTGMDPKWPRKPGGQVQFVAESMAGAEWNLTPSTSREYIRLEKPRKGPIPTQDQGRWLRTIDEPEQDDE